MTVTKKVSLRSLINTHMWGSRTTQEKAPLFFAK